MNTPYQPSRTDAALERVRHAVRPPNMEQGARLWIEALGGTPRKAEECITPFSFVGRCFHCNRRGLMTLVLAGFKGEFDSNNLLCGQCIDTIL